MSVISDPIADLFTRIRNAVKAYHSYVDIDRSKFKMAIIELLKKHGYIENFLVKDLPHGRGIVRIFLKYGANRTPVIQGIQRVSKPSRHLYLKSQDMPRIYGGMGMVVISTSKGVMSGKEARYHGLGGEYVGNVW